MTKRSPGLRLLEASILKVRRRTTSAIWDHAVMDSGQSAITRTAGAIIVIQRRKAVSHDAASPIMVSNAADLVVRSANMFTK